MVLAGSGLRRNSYSERSSLAMSFVRIAILIVCVFLSADNLPLHRSPVRKLAGAMKDVRQLPGRAVPLFATLAAPDRAICFIN